MGTQNEIALYRKYRCNKVEIHLFQCCKCPEISKGYWVGYAQVGVSRGKEGGWSERLLGCVCACTYTHRYPYM